ncbi:reverse transcriptase domain-containing protein, partial [Tanacetum coccineum]
ARLFLISPSDMEFTYALHLNFTSTSNKAEYEALLAGIHMAARMKVQTLDVKVDSKLFASQINESYVANSTSMIKYLATGKECIIGFKSFTIQNILKNLNQKADVSAIVEEEEDNWMTPIIKYLEEGVWPEDKSEARTLRMKINQYVLEGGVLFKKCYMRQSWMAQQAILWAHQTSLKQSNGETPFSLTYGSEAVIPTEIGMHAHRTMMLREDEKEDELHLNMDLLQERREATVIREARYKTQMEQYYNQNIRLTSFKTREYVFRRNESSRVEDQGKLGPKCEGPYRVTEAYQNGSYKLQTMKGKEVPRAWHAINLRRCYL